MLTRLLRFHLSLLLLVAAASFTVHAQWTTTGTNVNTLGKIGIGFATAPTANLDINGAGTSTTMNLFSGSNTTSSSFTLGRQAADGKISIAGFAGNFSTDAATGDLVIRTEGTIRKILFNTNGGSSASSLAISGSSIGIGTTAPGTSLDVRAGNGRITCDAIYFYGGTAGTSGSDGLPNVRLEDSYGMRFRANNDGHYVLSSQTSIVAGYSPNGSIDYGLGNIVASGRIGIGKVPGGAALLDIADVTTAGIALVNVGNDAYLTDIDAANILGIYGQSDNTQGGIKLGSSGPTIYGAATGNVGIGTANPGSKLHVAGDLRVDGKIIMGNVHTAADVMLSVNGSIYSKATIVIANGWSDHVLGKNYRLRSLDEVESYISSHQHLPEIPSEKEVVEKGLDTGEMLKLQMAKIEELTLYIIAQEKRIRQLGKTK